MQIIPKNKQKTTAWSGGLTTELYIFPEDSSYSERNFKYRLSTATVEIETSTFTPLPGVDRTLMVLEGKMDLEHENHHNSSLAPLQKDEFKGEWKTTSKGTCVDLNLMCRDGAKGELSGYFVLQKESVALNLGGVSNYLYLYSGELKVDDSIIDVGSFVIFDSNQKEIHTKAIATARFVLIEIANIQSY